MEYQNQIQTRNINLCLVIIFWISAIIHLLFFIILYNSFDINISNNNEYYIYWILLGIFISYLLTAIFASINYNSYRRKLLYLCLIPSLFNEFIFIALLIDCVIYLVKDNDFLMIDFIIILLIDNCPNIILFIHINAKTKNTSSHNKDNINNNSSLLNRN